LSELWRLNRGDERLDTLHDACWLATGLMSRRSIAGVVLAQFVVLVSVCLLIGDNSWDDGAITLAFSRTFARYGRVALTPRSEIVEGFSSVSWFLINSLAALARPSYRSTIAVSQILSALCICATTVVLARTCALLRFDRLFSTLTVIAFAAWACSFSEAGNGMEMGLLAAAFLILINELLAPRPRLFCLGAGVVLAITTRFEAVFYVALLALSVLTVPGRRAFWGIVLSCLGTALLLSCWRLAVFSDVLPNTFWAKRWPPYAGFGPLDRVSGLLELPSFFLLPLIGLAIARCSGFDLTGALRSHRRTAMILAAPVLGAVLMGALIGSHWGYRGRMPYFAFPPALLSAALLLSAWVNAQRTPFRVRAAVGLFVGAIATSMMGFPSGALAAAFEGGAFGVTPHTYAESGRIFRHFMSAAGLPRATILTADVGGLALCCDELRIVDLGLLSNRELAHGGPLALEKVLEAESPELVEAHWQWASSGDLYDLRYFHAHYVPAFGDRTKLWIRRDVADAIERNGQGCRVLAGRADLREALRTHRYADHDSPEDRRSFELPGTVFVLASGDASAGSLCK
jgi:hypothetical protein